NHCRHHSVLASHPKDERVRNPRAADLRPRRRSLDRGNAFDFHARPGRCSPSDGLWRPQRIRPGLWLEGIAHAETTPRAWRKMASTPLRCRVVPLACPGTPELMRFLVAADLKKL